MSAYFQYRQPTINHVERLERVLSCLSGKVENVIIGADVNAKSSRWFSSRTDNKGELLENFIDSRNLYVLNRAG